MTARRYTAKERKRLAALVDEASVDCYTEEEQHVGLLTMIESEVQCPFKAKVIGEAVEVAGFEMARGRPGLYAVCRYHNRNHRVDISSLEWVKPYPKGFEWIEAYRFWCEGG